MDRTSRLPALFRAMRPRHWIKNVFVFAALVFAHELVDVRSAGLAVAAFVVFCLLSSSVYLLNDIADREADRLHPVKRRRPVASGELSPAGGRAGRAAAGRRRPGAASSPSPHPSPRWPRPTC